MFEAIQSLSMAIAKYSDNVDLYAVRASLYMEQGKPAAALQDFSRHWSLHLMMPPYWLTGQVYRQFGQIAEALADLDKAIKINPDLLPARFNRGANYYSSGEYKRALEDFDQCIVIDPHEAGPYFNRASIKQALGDAVGAKNDLNRFIQLSSSEQWKSTARELLIRWEKDDSSTANEVPKSWELWSPGWLAFSFFSFYWLFLCMVRAQIVEQYIRFSSYWPTAAYYWNNLRGILRNSLKKTRSYLTSRPCSIKIKSWQSGMQ